MLPRKLNRTQNRRQCQRLPIRFSLELDSRDLSAAAGLPPNLSQLIAYPHTHLPRTKAKGATETAAPFALLQFSIFIERLTSILTRN
jgi:hypothetical protein